MTTRGRFLRALVPPLVVLLCLGALTWAVAATAARGGPPAAEPPARAGAEPVPSPSPTPPPPPPPPELPRGGTSLFPEHRLVGYSGGPGSAAFGRLGTGTVDQRMLEIEDYGRKYAAGRTPLPVVELITVVTHGSPGRDGRYRSRIDDAVVDAWLANARRHRALLLLNVQPGRSDFLTEVRGLERWLREPDVGVALDPEWAVGPKQVPGRVYGSTTGAELDAVAGYLSSLVAAHRLPDKAMVVHQLSPRIITGFEALRAHPGVEPVLSVDGIGGRTAKEATWRRLVARKPATVHAGFKLFFDEDREHGPLMLPPEVLALRPEPEYVLYE